MPRPNHLFLAALTLCVFGLAAACSSAPPKPDAPAADEAPAHSPPEDATPKMPTGPDVLRSGPTASGEPAAAEGEGLDAEVPTVARAQVDTFIDRGPSYALTQVAVEPSLEAGTFKGFQIVDVSREARNFLMPQVRVGDVITHLNGIPQAKPDDYLQAWKTLSDVSTIRIDFLRQNEAMHALWKVE